MKSIGNKGKSYFLSVIIFLCIILIFSLSYEYLRMITITKGIREAVKNSARSASANNFYNIYSDIRDIDWDYKSNKIDNFIPVNLIKEKMENYLMKDLDLKQNANAFNRVLKSGKLEYSLKNLNIEIKQISKNNTINENDETQKTRYLILTTVDISIFFGGAFEKVSPLQKTLETETGISTSY